jgi:hypothetical protein
MTKKIIIIISFIFYSFNLYAIDYFVSPTGDDENNGLSWSTAFATVTQAYDAAVDNQGDTIHVAEGEYLMQSEVSAEITLNKRGVKILGYGNGAVLIGNGKTDSTNNNMFFLYNANQGYKTGWLENIIIKDFYYAIDNYTSSAGNKDNWKEIKNVVFENCNIACYIYTDALTTNTDLNIKNCLYIDNTYSLWGSGVGGEVAGQYGQKNLKSSVFLNSPLNHNWGSIAGCFIDFDSNLFVYSNITSLSANLQWDTNAYYFSTSNAGYGTNFDTSNSIDTLTYFLIQNLNADRIAKFLVSDSFVIDTKAEIIANDLFAIEDKAEIIANNVFAIDTRTQIFNAFDSSGLNYDIIKSSQFDTSIANQVIYNTSVLFADSLGVITLFAIASKTTDTPVISQKQGGFVWNIGETIILKYDGYKGFNQVRLRLWKSPNLVTPVVTTEFDAMSASDIDITSLVNTYGIGLYYYKFEPYMKR